MIVGQIRPWRTRHEFLKNEVRSIGGDFHARNHRAGALVAAVAAARGPSSQQRHKNSLEIASKRCAMATRRIGRLVLRNSCAPVRLE